MLPVLSLLLPSLIPSAHAFAPTEIGDPGAPARTYPSNAGPQVRLRQQAGWQAFLAGEGAGWVARFDERTGTAHRAWGPSIPLGPLADRSAVDAAMRGLFARQPGLIGVDAAQLKLKTANYLAETDTWYVEYDRYVPVAGGQPGTQAGGPQALPLYGAAITARIRGERLMLLGIDSYPELQSVGAAEIGRDQAFLLAATQGPIGLNAREDLTAVEMILPLEQDGSLALRRVWAVRSRAEIPPGLFQGFVDAQSGALLAWFNEYRSFSGTVYGTHATRTLDGSYSTSPMPLLDIDGGNGGGTTTAADGSFTLPDGAQYTAVLEGDYATVENDAGGEGALSFSSGSPTWTTASATQAEISSYVFVHQVRDWGLQFGPEVDMVTDPLLIIVNQNQTCNAYFDGNLNFFRAGDGCNNTGEIGDVVYHEWGHGYHYYSLQAGTFDSTISEGLSDCVAFFQTLDPYIAPYFGTDGSAIRRVDQDRVYPDDLVNESHEDGLIFAGAIWDLLAEMSATYNETPYASKGRAWAETAELFTNGIKAGGTLESIFEDFVVADDDNNDLSDGTPHLCELLTAFGQHGLGYGGQGGLLSIDHLSLQNQAAQVDIPVTAALQNLAPLCNDAAIQSASIRWSVDGGGWQEAAMNIQDLDVSGNIPAQADGAIVSYYLEIDDGNDTMLWPPGGERAPYTFYVGGLEELYCETFDSSDGGYTHALLDGTDREGADDWVYGGPGGLSGDPVSAFTGRQVWGNDRGGGNYNGAYQSDIVNRLSSVSIDTQGASTLIVQYRRWLTVEDGIYDRARVYGNDAILWENHASDRAGDEHTQDVDWVQHTLRIEGGADPLVLGWEIASDGGLEFGGWNVDDVCVYRTADSTIIPGGDTGDDTGTGSDAGDTGADEGQNLDSGKGIDIAGGCACSAGDSAGGRGAGLAAGLLLAGLAIQRRRATA